VDFMPVLSVGPAVAQAKSVHGSGEVSATIMEPKAPVRRLATPQPVAPASPAPNALQAPMPTITPAERHPLMDTDPVRRSKQRELDALLERYNADAPHRQFVTDHHTIVFGEGDPDARLVFVGEAPGADEDRLGRPFVGRAGQLLDKMITAMGIARRDVYICNVLKTRPPNNATPTLEEAALCAPYLYEQLAIVDPEVIVALGLPASRTILNSTESMGTLRGTWAMYRPPTTLTHASAKPIAVMPTYHPAFLLRSYTKENRQKVWSDLQQVVARLGLTPTASSTDSNA
jgi:uracil-DNA glycosylase